MPFGCIALYTQLGDVDDLLAERGLTALYEIIHRWVRHFVLNYARRPRARRRTGRWHLDEMVVSVAGRQTYLWRAVDDQDEILDLLIQAGRDEGAALRLMR